jgi:pimeloyl-ACP methyl ester carboxylesterase
MNDRLAGAVSGLYRAPVGGNAADAPLIVAIHGGTYDSGYFDVPGYSLLDRASANGVPVVAPDRPGYGDTEILLDPDGTIREQAKYLSKALMESWRRYGTGTRGIVLIGHSIGGAIAASIASDPGELPVIGLAISGVGLRTPPEHKPMWEALPPTPTVELESAMKDQVMFGPEGSFYETVPAASHIADRPGVRAELVDIVSTWHDNVRDILGRIAVPVHYRQGEHDRLWIVDQGEVDGFAAACTSSPRVDAAMMRGTGHCMDFHKVGAAFHAQQIGFALQCGAERSYL